MRIRQLLRPGAPLLLALLLTAGLSAQVEELKHSNPKRRMRAAQKLGGLGDPQHIAALRELLKDPVADVRATAVDSIVRIGTQHSLDPLMAATRNSIPGIQIMAVDGLVNFYKIGYVGKGFKASLKNFGRDVRNRFAQPSEVIIEPYLDVSPDVVKAIARVIDGGSSMESRANAARAAGVLRGQGALAELKEALRSKDTILILEAVRAIEKIGDLKAGRSLTFLLHDLDGKCPTGRRQGHGPVTGEGVYPRAGGLDQDEFGKEDPAASFDRAGQDARFRPAFDFPALLERQRSSGSRRRRGGDWPGRGKARFENDFGRFCQRT